MEAEDIVKWMLPMEAEDIVIWMLPMRAEDIVVPETVAEHSQQTGQWRRGRKDQQREPRLDTRGPWKDHSTLHGDTRHPQDTVGGGLAQEYCWVGWLTADLWACVLIN